jgi:Zn finger protein HypA/HybF involved in hydrogenase expression
MEAIMSILNEHQKTSDPVIAVTCWRCDAPMRIKTISPAMASTSLDEIVYRCPACNIERKQVVSRSN